MALRGQVGAAGTGHGGQERDLGTGLGGLRRGSPLGSEGCPGSRGGGSGVGTVVPGGLRAGSAGGGCGGSGGSGGAMSVPGLCGVSAARAHRLLARRRVGFTLGLPRGRVSCQRLPGGVGGLPAQLLPWQAGAASPRHCPRWAAAGSGAVMDPTTEGEGGEVGGGEGPRKTLVELSSRVPRGFARLVAAGFGG